MPTCSAHRRRLPPPIRSREEALTAIDLATDSGRDDVVALACLDRDRRPLTMFIVERCSATPADVLAALDVLLDAVSGVTTPLDALILAASRPGGPAVTEEDVSAWAVSRRRCADARVDLLEFFVVAGGEAKGVGDLVGEGPAW